MSVENPRHFVYEYEIYIKYIIFVYKYAAIVFWPRAHVDCVVHQSEAGKQLHEIEEAEEAKRQKLLAEQ